MALTASYIAPCTIARCRTDTGAVWPAVAPKAVAAYPFQSVTTSARAGATSARNAETATRTPTRRMRCGCTAGSFPRAVPLRWPPPHAQGRLRRLRDYLPMYGACQDRAAPDTSLSARRGPALAVGDDIRRCLHRMRLDSAFSGRPRGPAHCSLRLTAAAKAASVGASELLANVLPGPCRRLASPFECCRDHLRLAGARRVVGISLRSAEVAMAEPLLQGSK